MKLFFTSIVLLLLASVPAESHRKIKIIAYPYIPDLAGDSLEHLADFLQDRFFADTGRRIQILFDFDYNTDTYTPRLVKKALSPVDGEFGGYDMQEIDSIILGYLLNHDVLQKIPDGVNFDNYPQQTLKMVTDNDGTRWGHPSYTCTNIFYSYKNSIKGLSDFTEFQGFVTAHRQPGQLGWTGDLSSEPDLRLEYLDGWRDSHPDAHWVSGGGYSDHLSDTDTNVVNNIKYLRDTCADPTGNRCTNGTFYNEPDKWFSLFASGGSLVLQGFPEYTSEILAIANADPMHPTKLHTPGPAVVGNGDQPFLFTDSWVISKTNCEADCLTTVKIFLTWQQQNWAELISLGADLTPQRPRFLAVAYQPFYTSPAVDALPQFAKNYYHFFNGEINRAVHLNTLQFWDNEDSQGALLESLILM